MHVEAAKTGIGNMKHPSVRKNGMFTGTVQVVDSILFSKDVDIDQLHQYNAGFDQPI